MLRGGAYKPRTSPYAFQGLGEIGLNIWPMPGPKPGLPVVTEVMEPDQVDLVSHYADMLQVGSRNMQNYPLLRRVGQSQRPVLLKRGFLATIEEWLMAAEYILAQGNPNVVLCERGIRAFDPAFRFTLDLNAVPMVKELTHLPVIARSQSRHRQAFAGRADVLGRDRRRRGRIDPGGSSGPDAALCDAARKPYRLTTLNDHQTGTWR